MTFTDAISLAVRYTLYRYSMRVFTSYLGFGAVTFEMAISIDIVEVTDSSSVSPIPLVVTNCRAFRHYRQLACVMHRMRFTVV